MSKMLMIQADKCTGCHNCELACAMTHEGNFRITAARVHVYTWEREGFSVPMMCQQCHDAPCIPVCTPHAMTRDPVTGWVNLDQAKCIGCKMCVHACPFGNAVWDDASTTDPQVRQLRAAIRPARSSARPARSSGSTTSSATQGAQAGLRGQVQGSVHRVRWGGRSHARVGRQHPARRT